jgi:hypothetical protein
MKVKIIKASNETYWYASLIGHVFDVVLSDNGLHYVYKPDDEDDSLGYGIKFNDAFELIDEETSSPSYYESSTASSFDLEEQIMQCWSIIDQIDTVTEGVDVYGWTADQISNALIGIKEIYNLEFEKMLALQETLLRSGKLK